MGPLAAFDSSTMCGFDDKVVQERMNGSSQLPLEMLITRIGLGVIFGTVLLVGLKACFEATLSDYLFDRRKGR